MMDDWLVYVIGYPGSGKTTAMRAAIGMENRLGAGVQKQPFAHTVYPSGLVELGYDRETYGGTDSLALNVQPAVVKWLEDVAVPVIVGEGDRLANRKFFDAVVNLGRHLAIVHIKCDQATAKQRAWERGSRFNAAWLKGRISKVDSLVTWCKDNCMLTEIDGSAHPKDVGRELATIIEGRSG